MKKDSVYIISAEEGEFIYTEKFAGVLRVHDYKVLTLHPAAKEHDVWGPMPRFLYLANHVLMLVEFGINKRVIAEVKERSRLPNAPPLIYCVGSSIPELPKELSKRKAEMRTLHYEGSLACEHRCIEVGYRLVDSLFGTYEEFNKK